MSCPMPQGHPTHCGCSTPDNLEKSATQTSQLPAHRVEAMLDMSAGNPTAAKHHKVQGRVCEKHPELKGLRYKTSRSCLGCREERRLKRMEDLKRVPLLEDEIANLQAQLRELQLAAAAVLDSRDEDDAPQGYPGHLHNKPGHWDKDGSVCKWCSNYSKLEALLPAGHRYRPGVVIPKLTDWLIRTPTTANLLQAAEMFFSPGLIKVEDDIVYVQHGLGYVVWSPMGDLEHALHLAEQIGARVRWGKGIEVAFIDMNAHGEFARFEKVVELWVGQGRDRALMMKICQIAVYLAKCQASKG